MEFKDVLNGRYSCRKFLDKQVSAELIKKIVEVAVRAPSWGNTQPWKVYAVGGDTAKALREENAQAIQSGKPGVPDVEMPGKFEGELKARYGALGRALFEKMGLGREDQDGRMAHYINNYNAFGAPSMVFITVPKGQTPYVILDGGAIATTICLEAYELGLGTCIQAALATYPDVVRKYVDIPEDEDLLIGIALGYPDPEAPANAFRSDRMPLEEMLKIKDM